MTNTASALTECWRSKTAREDWLPEQRLAIAVLDQAIDEAHGIITMTSGYPTTQQRERVRVQRDACDWLASNATDHLFTFVSVCRLLGLNPSAVRREVK